MPYLSVNDEMDIYPLCIHIDCLAAHGPFCVSSQCRVRLASPFFFLNFCFFSGKEINEPSVKINFKVRKRCEV